MALFYLHSIGKKMIVGSLNRLSLLGDKDSNLE